VSRIDGVTEPYFGGISSNYDYGAVGAGTAVNNEIFQNVMKKAAISTLLNDSSGQNTSGESSSTEDEEDSSYSDDLRQAWQTLRAQEEEFYRSAAAKRKARKVITKTETSSEQPAAQTTATAASGTGSSAFQTAAVSAAADSGVMTGTSAVSSDYHLNDDGTVMMNEIFEKASAKYGVSTKLLKAIAKEESGFQPGVVSSAGAVGVMQLMPGTATSLGVTDAYDAEQNIMGGAKLIAQLMNQYYHGDLTLALAAYNAGPGNVARYGGAPPYTQKYISTIEAIMQQDEPVVNIPVKIASTASQEAGTAASEEAEAAV